MNLRGENPMFVKGNDIKTTKMAEGIERKILGHSDRIMVVEVYFKKAAVAQLHSHVHEQVSYIVKGTFEFTVGDTTEVLTSGDSAYIPSGVLHKVTALEDGVVTDSFTPAREDFLK